MLTNIVVFSETYANISTNKLKNKAMYLSEIFSI